MKHKKIISVRSLQIFAEGGNAAGGVSADGDTAQGPGVTAPAAGVQQTTEAQPDRNAEFEKLIKGEYKDLYDARMQDTVQKRLKNQKETVEKYEALAPSLEILAQKYGVDPTDAKALSKAIEEDDSYFADEAAAKGVSVEQLKRYRKMERENAQFRAQMETQNRKDHAARQYATWMQQAEEARRIYPGLNLDAEVKNPQFLRLLNAGVDVGSAYLVIHQDNIIPAAMQHTAKVVEQKITNKIAAGASRPAENGTNSQGAAVVKSDVSQLTKMDRAEINRRVARGERISFG